jgi:AhpD family alkylhydroperoxidase
MRLPPLRTIPLILRPQAWLHRRHYGEVLSPIRWWGRIPLVFYLVSMFVGYLERKRSPLDPVLRALVSARIAQMCLCEFCVDITSMKLAERTGSAEKLFAVAAGARARCSAKTNVWRWSMPKPPALRRQPSTMRCAASSWRDLMPRP